jgi:hypothetical protein
MASLRTENYAFYDRDPAAPRSAASSDTPAPCKEPAPDMEIAMTNVENTPSATSSQSATAVERLAEQAEQLAEQVAEVGKLSGSAASIAALADDLSSEVSICDADAPVEVISAVEDLLAAADAADDALRDWHENLEAEWTEAQETAEEAEEEAEAAEKTE